MSASTAMDVTKPDEPMAERRSARFGDFDRATGFLLRIAAQASMSRFYPRLSGIPTTVGEFTVLMAVGENPGIRQGMLADVLQIKWPSMTKLVRGLESRALLRRFVPPEDRRAVELFLTAEGEATVEGARPTMLGADRESLAMLSDGEYRQLLVLLRKAAGWEPEVAG